MEVRIPEFEGQVCTIVTPLADENPEDVYIVAEDPAPFDGDDDIYVVNLNDLQRNIDNPVICQQIPVAKNELNVIADNLHVIFLPGTASPFKNTTRKNFKIKISRLNYLSACSFLALFRPYGYGNT